MVDAFLEAYPEADRWVAIKFLRGRKFVEERAHDCYEHYKALLSTHNLGSVTVATVLPELRTQKMYLPGTRDRAGAALFVINAARHVPHQFSDLNTLSLAFYLAELLTESPQTQAIGVTIIISMDGMEWANFDNQFQRTIIDFFQRNIPARVRAILLYKCPWWVSMTVKLMAPFLKEKIVQRIHLCEDADEILEHVPIEALPVELGGSLAYDHEAFIRGEMVKAPNASFQRIVAGNSMCASGRALPPTGDGAVPMGTVMLVSKDLAAKLRAERQRVLGELDAKIEHHRQMMERHTVPLDLVKVYRSRPCRMSLDLASVPEMEPNLLHVHDEHTTDGGAEGAALATQRSPIKEQPDEDYERGALERRIHESILTEREAFIQRWRAKREGGALLVDNYARGSPGRSSGAASPAGAPPRSPASLRSVQGAPDSSPGARQRRRPIVGGAPLAAS